MAMNQAAPATTPATGVASRSNKRAWRKRAGSIISHNFCLNGFAGSFYQSRIGCNKTSPVITEYIGRIFEHRNIPDSPTVIGKAKEGLCK